MTLIRTVLADSQELFIEGLERLLLDLDYPKIKITDRARNAEELISILSKTPVDLVFTDVRFEDMDGMALIKHIKENYPETRICVMSGYTDHHFVKDAFKRGADGYYSKSNTHEELQKCVSEMMAGNTFLASGVQITPSKNAKLREHHTSMSSVQDRFLLKKKLTKREQQVLELITKALNNKEIAEQLFISDQTVGVHRKNIMRKLNVRNTVNLIKFAIDYQLV